MNLRLERSKLLAVGAAALAATVLLLAGELSAGGTIGWAEAVSQFSDEGVSVGEAAVVLGIVVVGAIVMFNQMGLVGTISMFCLGGALMAGAETIGTSLFQGGAGGGSILATGYAEHVLTAAPTPIAR